jgi:hypothetical protein
MNRSLAPYTGRVRPLRYNSLTPDTRRRNIVTGTLNGRRIRNLFGIVAYRVEAHTVAADDVFNRPESVAYADGPIPAPAPPPFIARWAAWVSTSGIRVARTSLVTPPSATTGAPSRLYPSTVPVSSLPRITLGFNMDGLMAIAIQKTATQIELKRYTDPDETVATVAFPGSSPALFNTGILHFGGEQEFADELACLYLKRDTPTTVYARFEGEGFATEHVAVDNLISEMTRLIGAEAVNGRMTLYGRDVDGRDVTLTSAPYQGDTGPNSGTLGVAFTGGAIHASAVHAEPDADRASIGLAFTSARVGAGAASPGELDPEKPTLTIAFTGGSVR